MSHIYPKLPPEQNRSRKLLPTQIEVIKALMPNMIACMGKKRAYRSLGERYGVSESCIIRNCVWSEDKRKAHDAHYYQKYKDRLRVRNNSSAAKESRKRHAREKRLRQNQEMRDYRRPISREYRRVRDNEYRRNKSIEDALVFFKTHTIHEFNKHYKNPHFVKKVVQREPLLTLIVEGGECVRQ